MNPPEPRSLLRFALLALLGALALGMLISGYRAYRERKAWELLNRVNARIRVEVLNGAGVPRLGLTAAKVLRAQGFDVVYIGNADSLVSQTQIIERASPDLRHVRALARTLRCGKVTVELDPNRLLEVSLILGEDYRSCAPRLDPKTLWIPTGF